MKKITNRDVLGKIFSKITEEDAGELLKLFIVEEKSLVKGHAFVANSQSYLVTDDLSKTLGIIKSVSLSLEGVGIDGDDFTIELPDDVEDIVDDIVDEDTTERLEEIESGEVEPISVDLDEEDKEEDKDGE